MNEFLHMKTSTSKDIVKYLQVKGASSAKDIGDHFSISRQALFKHHLPKIQESGEISKLVNHQKSFILSQIKKQ